MRRFRDLISAHKRFSFGMWILVLVAVVVGAQWKLTSGGSTTRTQVLGASAKKPDVTPPLVSVTFPANNGVYGPSTWTGCSPVGICGSASDDSGVAQVDVAVQQVGGNYWTGSGFTSSQKVSLAAKGTTSWNLPLALPAVGGPYTVSVTATDKGKPANTNSSTTSPATVTFTFTVDRTPPAVPVITLHPDNPVRDTTATFEFTDTDSPVTFQCKLDSGAFGSCTSPGGTAYPNLAMGDHTFSVRALDTVGNPSESATFTWTIATGSFGISVADPIPTLYPGMAPATLDLTFTNPYNFTLNITGVRVGVDQVTFPGTGTPPNPDCVSSESLSVTPVQPATWTISVAPHSTRSLSNTLTSATPISRDTWPKLQMLNLSTNQDTCKNKTFALTYSGTGTK